MCISRRGVGEFLYGKGPDRTEGLQRRERLSVPLSRRLRNKSKLEDQKALTLYMKRFDGTGTREDQKEEDFCNVPDERDQDYQPLYTRDRSRKRDGRSEVPRKYSEKNGGEERARDFDMYYCPLSRKKRDWEPKKNRGSVQGNRRSGTRSDHKSLCPAENSCRQREEGGGTTGKNKIHWVGMAEKGDKKGWLIESTISREGRADLKKPSCKRRQGAGIQGEPSGKFLKESAKSRLSSGNREDEGNQKKRQQEEGDHRKKMPEAPKDEEPEKRTK